MRFFATSDRWVIIISDFIISGYNQQIVEFLRQPNIDDVLGAKDPSYDNNLALKYVIILVYTDVHVKWVFVIHTRCPQAISVIVMVTINVMMLLCCSVRITIFCF